MDITSHLGMKFNIIMAYNDLVDLSMIIIEEGAVFPCWTVRMVVLHTAKCNMRCMKDLSVVFNLAIIYDYLIAVMVVNVVLNLIRNVWGSHFC